jgi:hypothetical protein
MNTLCLLVMASCPVAADPTPAAAGAASCSCQQGSTASPSTSEHVGLFRRLRARFHRHSSNAAEAPPAETGAWSAHAARTTGGSSPAPQTATPGTLDLDRTFGESLATLPNQTSRQAAAPAVRMPRGVPTTAEPPMATDAGQPVNSVPTLGPDLREYH